VSDWQTTHQEDLMRRIDRSLRAFAAQTAAIAIAMTAGLSLLAPPAPAAAPITIAVADFDYTDTSGEVNDQSAAHSARVAQFVELVRENLTAQGDYRVLPFDCPAHPCTPISMRPDDFIAAARRSGARFVVYGGIRKMSTLVQWGDVELLDLETEKLLLQRTVSFRGDNDDAFRRAAAFVGDTLRAAMPKP
jgi:Protein of unknown function (DUF2380)